MLTLRRRSSREDVSLLLLRDRPVLLATLDVPFAEEAIAFAVDSAVESGQPLVLVNAAEVLPTAYSLLGYGYVEREDLQDALRKPAELAHSLAVRGRAAARVQPASGRRAARGRRRARPGLLVFGPDRAHCSSRRYRRAERAVRERASCLVWFPRASASRSVAVARPDDREERLVERQVADAPVARVVRVGVLGMEARLGADEVRDRRRAGGRRPCSGRSRGT